MCGKKISQLLRITVLVFLLSSVASLKASSYWQGAVALEGDWFLDTNWSPTGVPGSDTVAIITNAGTAVIASGEAEVYQLIVSDFFGRLRQTGGSLTTGPEVPSYIGRAQGSNGFYELSGGVFRSNNLIVADRGYGKFTASGGEAYIGTLSVASGAYSSGEAYLSAGRLEATAETIGGAGSGYFGQSGGYHHVTGMLDVQALSDFTLNGAGVLDVKELRVSAGDFRQYAGECNAGVVHVTKSGTSGSYELWGGTFSTPNLYVGAGQGGSFSQNGGLAEVSGGLCIAEDSSFVLWDGLLRTPMVTRSSVEAGQLSLVGGRLETSVIEFSDDNMGTILAPYIPTGLLQIVSTHGGGNYTQTGGTLALGIAGHTPGADQGQLVVDSALSLAGTVEIDFLDGFRAQTGDRFTIATCLSGAPVLNAGTSLIFDDPGYLGRLETVGSNIDLVMLTPEPATVSLLAVGALAAIRRRK